MSTDATRAGPAPQTEPAGRDAASARLFRLQRITAALSNTFTHDKVAESVLRESIVALECDAGAVVICPEPVGAPLELLREAGWLDPLLMSFTQPPGGGPRTPYTDAIADRAHVYLESFEEMSDRYPEFALEHIAANRGAWIFLPLAIEERVVGVISFGFGSREPFSFLDRQFADAVARYCAQALDRVQLRMAAATALDEAHDARLRAEKADSAKTLFLRAMSHELRTPLNAISGYTELLELGIRGPVNPDQQKDLGRIKRASSYLLRLIDDVLMVARMEGERPLRLMPVALNSVLTEVGDLCVLQAKACGLRLEVTPFDPDVEVRADPERLQQVLLNLLTNAIKFTSPGGTVSLFGSLAEGVARLHVKDTGVGVRAEDQDRVFEAFVQVERYRTAAAHQGIGLGLSISRDLARAMHGELSLESAEGAGATFTLTLPLC